MTKHTPGDCWEVTWDGDGVHVGFSCWPMNTVETDEVNDIEELKANANLIAAAPELLEALERIASDPECPDHVANYILPVIAKARGES